ncbi:MAG: hypothetical protein IJ629_04515 [Clostridia bacterium]|nr:hypothetical protein [Clostridia bacterium]
MDKKELLEKLEKNMKDLKTVDEKYSMLMLALYQKTIQEVREQKLKEVKEYFSNQVKYYNQVEADYQGPIEYAIKEYTKQIDGLIEAYDYLYMNSFKSMQKAINNQLIAIGNAVTLWNKKDQLNGADTKEIEKKMTAVIQKKVNYSVIVEECKSRLNWCVQNASKDMYEIFENNFYQLEVYRDSFFARLKRKIMNAISGKKKMAEVIDQYSIKDLKQIEYKNRMKIAGIIATATGVLKQIELVEKEIDYQYETAVQSA